MNEYDVVGMKNLCLTCFEMGKNDSSKTDFIKLMREQFPNKKLASINKNKVKLGDQTPDSYNFIFERYHNMNEILEHIKMCEGKHTQQVVFSSFHNAMTQICFSCKAIRTNIMEIK